MKKALASLLCLIVLFAACGRQKIVKEVIITGNHRTSTDVIKANIHTQPGAVNQATLNADIQRLRSLGVFVDYISVSDTAGAHILKIHVSVDLPRQQR
jgi:outer membrane protein assembly factor BamA